MLGKKNTEGKCPWLPYSRTCQMQPRIQCRHHEAPWKSGYGHWPWHHHGHNGGVPQVDCLHELERKITTIICCRTNSLQLLLLFIIWIILLSTRQKREYLQGNFALYYSGLYIWKFPNVSSTFLLSINWHSSLILHPSKTKRIAHFYSVRII